MSKSGIVRKQGDVITVTSSKILLVESGYLAAFYEYYEGDRSLAFVIGKGAVLKEGYVYHCLSDTHVTIHNSLNSTTAEKAEAMFYKAIESYNLSKGHTNVQDKILHFLWSTFDLYGQPEGNKRVLPFELSHEAIASGVGAVRVTVTRAMKEFSLIRGYLETQRKRPIVMTLEGQLYCQRKFT